MIAFCGIFRLGWWRNPENYGRNISQKGIEFGEKGHFIDEIEISEKFNYIKSINTSLLEKASKITKSYGKQTNPIKRKNTYKNIKTKTQSILCAVDDRSDLVII